jgi:DNA-binding transcriptional MerR regulator
VPPHPEQGLSDPVITIGVLADRVGLSVSAIRKYEEEGLLISHRRGSKHRLFSFEDIERIQAFQHMLKDLGFNIEGIRRMQALLPCWDLQPCSRVVRDRCQASRDNTRPCWMMKNGHCKDNGGECRVCDVYRFGTQCTADIKELLHERMSGKARSAAMKKLMEKKRERK